LLETEYPLPEGMPLRDEKPPAAGERGKGDHWHFQGVETAYVFSTVEQLMADFWADVHRLRGTK